MRLKAQIKLGYYATPPSVVRKIKRWLRFPNGWNPKVTLFDPCAGEGDAILEIAEHAFSSGASPIICAVELDEKRFNAMKAKMPPQNEMISNIVHAPYERVKWDLASMSLMWLNPPYDDAGGGQGETRRKEIIFLEDLTPYLAPLGILVYIIPHKYISDYMARFLAKHYESIRVFSFDDDADGYRDYNQVVILARRKDQYRVNEDVVNMLRAARNGRPPVLPAGPHPGDLPYPVPTTTSLGHYTLIEYDSDEIIARSRVSSAWERMFDDVFKAERSAADNRPPIPLHSGHIGLLLASGELNGAFGKGPFPIEEVSVEDQMKRLGVKSAEEARKKIAELRAERDEVIKQLSEKEKQLKEKEGAGYGYWNLKQIRDDIELLRARLDKIERLLVYDSRHVIKGTAKTTKRRTVETDENGNTTEREIEQQVVSIKALTFDGRVISLV